MSMEVVHVFEPLVEAGQAHVGTELLEQDLHEDTTGRGGGVLTHLDTLHHLGESTYPLY